MRWPSRFKVVLLLICHVWLMPQINDRAAAQVLDPVPFLERETFWQNRDFDWYVAEIPFFDSPDGDLNTTYYYRWELVTRHLTYGSPNSGYSFTEFSDRPFWSGAYGSIACPAGHQINEVRWMRDPRYARDYLRYWFRTPGAQPQRYSFWAADSTWATHLVHPNSEFLADLLPDLLNNFEEWKTRHFVPAVGLYWQTGHDDGMEFDINAQQTQDILRGGQSLRPSFNAYQWADAVAIGRIARLTNQPEVADQYMSFAEQLKLKLQELLWDPRREFFFPMSNQRHEKDGHVVDRLSLTYQTGKYAGSSAGRELHGYVPWAFGMLDPGYEAAWKFLIDPNYFEAPFGPTTVERHDPQFALKPHCCWWSGQSWPFATTQTLKAMANVLHHYPEPPISRADYYNVLHRYAISHRKDGRPYIAEALHPDTGSWDGHDAPNHSEHYFHSGFVDLVITGLVGIQPQDDHQLVIDPLAPAEWDYFALDRLPYKGHVLSVLWDRHGNQYGKGEGLLIFVDGRLLASQPELGRIEVSLPESREVPLPKDVRFNYAVNNDGDWFPRIQASYTGPGGSIAFLQDGQVRYDQRPINRWTTHDSDLASQWVHVDLGSQRPIDLIKLYILDDEDGKIGPPQIVELEHKVENDWVPIPGQQPNLPQPVGRRPYEVRFPELPLREFRIVVQPEAGLACGLSEIEAWGPGQLPYQTPPPPAGNWAYRVPGADFPQASASFSDRFGGKPEMAIDGRLSYLPNPFNRWTAYESPHDQDWLEVDLGEARPIGRLVLHIYDDRGGVQPPDSYRGEFWQDGQWQNIENATFEPERPQGSHANTMTFMPVVAQKIRVVFQHRQGAKSGLTELEIWQN